MTRYYYLTLSLPELVPNVKPPMTFQELDELLYANLTAKDYAKTRSLRTYYDLQNMRALWTLQEIDPRGNFKENELEEAILQETKLPSYLITFLQTHETKEARLKFFPELLASYFQHQSQIKDPFLRKLFSLERKMQLLQTAFRSKKLQKNLTNELRFENPDEPFIEDLTAQKDETELEFPEEFEDFKQLMQEHYSSPMKLYNALQEYHFHKIDELVSSYGPFRFEKILGYLAQFMLLPNLNQIDDLEKVEFDFASRN